MKKKKIIKRRRGVNYSTSLLKTLRRQGKINAFFEVQLSQLTIEDIIALKLELSARSFGGKLYGYPIMRNITDITRDAIIKFALSATPSKVEACSLLGCSSEDLTGYIRKYGLKDFYEGKVGVKDD